jgi:hypothetical protein
MRSFHAKKKTHIVMMKLNGQIKRIILGLHAETANGMANSREK